MNKTCKHLQAIVFDWAGTTVDYGSIAPTLVFQKVFAQRGVVVTTAQAREPMGMAKREHIAAVAAMPEVAKSWQEQHRATCTESDIDSMYAEFLPLQKEILGEHSGVIPGIPEAVERCREMGLKIGSSTGYTKELMEIVTSAAAAQGYAPDIYLCSDDTPKGRPAPYLLFEAAKRLDVYPMWEVVKVDDTTVGIEAGRNAGCWTIGVTQTGNLVGLSEQEFAQQSIEEQDALCKQADEKLLRSGAHYTVRSVAEIPKLLLEIDSRYAAGARPV